MKTSELKNLTTEELQGRIAETKAKLESLEFNHAIAPLDNPMVIRTTRRDVARMLTELNNRTASAQVE